MRAYRLTRVTIRKINAIRKDSASAVTLFLPNASSLSAASEYFWHECEREFTVDGDLAKTSCCIRGKPTGRIRPTFPGYTAVSWNAREEAGRVRTDNYRRTVGYVSGSRMCRRHCLSQISFSRPLNAFLIFLSINYPTCISPRKYIQII